MIQLYQGKSSLGNFNQIVGKYHEKKVKIDRELVKLDIDKLRSGEYSKSKRDKDTIDKAILTLTRLLAVVDDNSEMVIQWVITHKGVISCLQSSLNDDLPFGLNFTKYIIMKPEEVMVRLDYSKVMELIAFEMMHRDLGVEKEDVESRLAHIGLTAISDPDIILDMLEGESAVNDSTFMKIGSSPYATIDNKMCGDYFNQQMFETDRYDKVVKFSCDQAITAILAENMQMLGMEGVIDYDICTVKYNGIYLKMPKTTQARIENKFKHVVVRVFGRKFEVNPSVHIVSLENGG